MSVNQLWFGSPAPAGPSTSEKQAYYDRNLAAAKAGTYTGKQIKPGVELLPGWKPWDGLGVTDGWQIAAAIARNGGDDLNSIVPGDWFTVDEPESTTDIKTTKYECNGRDLYYVAGDKTNGRHHFTFVPDTLWDFNRAYAASGSNQWATSDLKKDMEKWLSTQSATLQASVLELNIPFTNYVGSRVDVPSKVFPPSEYEAFGKVTTSKETPTGTPPYTPYVLLSRSNEDRDKAHGMNLYGYDLRSVPADNTKAVVIASWFNGEPSTSDGKLNALNANVYPTSSGALKLLQCPCINIG